MTKSMEMLVKELMQGMEMNEEIAKEYAKYLVGLAIEEYKKLFEKVL